MTVLPECIITYIVNPTIFQFMQIAKLYFALGTEDIVFCIYCKSGIFSFYTNCMALFCICYKKYRLLHML